MIDRTDAQIYGREPVPVTLAGRVYEIKPVTKARGRKFRKALTELGSFGVQISNTLNGILSAEAEVELTEIIGTVNLLLTDRIDEVFELVYVYSPEIAADRGRLDDEEHGATEPEWLEALVAVFRLAFGPFGQALGLNSGLLQTLQKVFSTELTKNTAPDSTGTTKNEPKQSSTPSYISKVGMSRT